MADTPGLAYNEGKTQIVHLSAGCDFLGFNVRRYGDKLLIKPSDAALRRIRERLRTEIHALRGSNAAAVIAALTPIIRGWAAYYRGVVAKKSFNSTRLIRVMLGRAGAALTTPGRASTARWYGSGKRDGEEYARNRRVTSP
ncbi:group II intron maturase-specific domain-containing protein [Nonomuraea sp. NPDC050404]|uniref:group II intron maturase-specific domain-containing protein n=1 Tax=Nonomuraea sp. NPDC050404 TaxID=3155783 RepID=UPI0033DB076A